MSALTEQILKAAAFDGGTEHPISAARKYENTRLLPILRALCEVVEAAVVINEECEQKNRPMFVLLAESLAKLEKEFAG